MGVIANRRGERCGYSIMEAMVALFVLAIASTGLLLATRAHIDTVGRLEDRVVGQWIAENRLTELTLRDSGADRVSMMGRDWQVSVHRTPTDDPELISVDIAVSRVGRDETAARLRGFLDAGAA